MNCFCTLYDNMYRCVCVSVYMSVCVFIDTYVYEKGKTKIKGHKGGHDAKVITYSVGLTNRIWFFLLLSLEAFGPA